MSRPATRPDSPASGRIKGAALLEFVRWFASEQGAPRLAEAVRRLPAESRRALELDADDPRILSSRWYEAAAIHALLDALTGDADEGDRRRLAEHGAAAIMRSTLRGVYRILFEWLATPERYARHANRLWQSYYDTGRLDVVNPDPSTARATIHDWPAHHPFLCDMHLYAAAEIYRAMGCTDVTVRREGCISGGDPHCAFVTTWKKRGDSASPG